MYYGHGYGYGKTKKAGAGFDPVAAAYFAAVPNSFSAARKTIINTLIAGLRSDGNLTKLDRLWLFANTTTGNAVIDVIGLNSATLVNAPAFVADQGYTGDGATSYINTNYNPSTNATNLSLNSTTIGIYTRTNTSNNPYHGCDNGTQHFLLREGGGSGTIIYALHNGTFPSIASLDAKGLTCAVRSGASSTVAYKNGNSVLTDTDTSVSIPNLNAYLCCRNASGTPSSFSDSQYSIYLFGSGTIDQSALFTRIEAYMDALGTGVV